MKEEKKDEKKELTAEELENATGGNSCRPIG
jgi:hypothetical protein